MSKDAKRRKEIEDFFNNPDPELRDALLNPRIIVESEQSLKNANSTITYPLLICDNPDTILPNVPKQLNFILPVEIKKSTDPYAINLKNDLNMYRIKYENYSKQVNEIIDKTKDCIKNFFPRLKKLRDEIMKYSKSYKNSIEQLSIPLINKRENLNQINYQDYEKDQQQNFLRDKNEIIKEINDFFKEANQFCENYEILNKNTFEETETFVKNFLNLSNPAKELSIFMINFFKEFEKSASQFSDLSNKEKIGKALMKIKGPISDFQKGAEKTLELLNPIEEIKKAKRIENVNEIVNNNKKIMIALKQKSKNISNKIEKIREKYGEPKKIMESMKIEELPSPPSLKECSESLEEKKKEINKEAKKQVNQIKQDVEYIINQTRLDLLFIMDITASMDFYLEQAQKGILDMMNEIRLQCAGIEIWLGFIGYRDFIDLDFGEEYINLEFTNNYENVQKNIENLIAQGGGDTPEDLCGAFEFAKEKHWRGKSRFAILVTDSPCHGTKYHNLREDEDNYPTGDRNSRNIEDFIKFFAKNEISLFCLDINPNTEKMFKIFKDIYEKNKKKDSNNQFVIQKGNELFKVVTENAVKTFQNRKNLE